jgi:hypothetical protein
MKRRDIELVYNLLRRVEWRQGSVEDRLLVVEQRAKWRAKTGAYGCDRKLERRLAKLARRLRKNGRRNG